MAPTRTETDTDRVAVVEPDTGPGDLAAVERWYQARGFGIIEQNWTGRDGTVALIARDGGQVVFCDIAPGGAGQRPILDLMTRGRINRMQSQWAGQQRRTLTTLRYDLAWVVAGGVLVHRAII